MAANRTDPRPPAARLRLQEKGLKKKTSTAVDLGAAETGENTPLARSGLDRSMPRPGEERRRVRPVFPFSGIPGPGENHGRVEGVPLPFASPRDCRTFAAHSPGLLWTVRGLSDFLRSVGPCLGPPVQAPAAASGRSVLSSGQPSAPADSIRLPRTGPRVRSSGRQQPGRPDTASHAVLNPGSRTGVRLHGLRQDRGDAEPRISPLQACGSCCQRPSLC
jgi:hypothetical protein